MPKKPSPFIEYANELYEEFVEKGLMKKPDDPIVVPAQNPDEKMQKSFNDIVLHASQEQRDKLGGLLIAEAVKQGESEEAVRKEWDALVNAIVENKMKEQAFDVQLPTVEDTNSIAYHMNPYSNSIQYNPTHKSKHQCNRKPKPKKRGVKHGNRKKK